MQPTGTPDVSARPSRSDQGNTGSTLQIGTKLVVRLAPTLKQNVNNLAHPAISQMNRVNKLVKWRIDPSLVKFPEDTRDVHGGYAAVSRAVLTTASSVKSSSDESENAGDRRKSRAINFLDKVRSKHLAILLPIAMVERLAGPDITGHRGKKAEDKE